ncbi:MAG: cytochrome c biogenesis protein CcsA [Wenzhouxiangellaceae bacterium]
MYAILAILAYLSATWLLADDLGASRPPRPWVKILALLGLALHGITLYTTGTHFGAPNATLFNVLSASGWIIAAVLIGVSLWRNALAPAVIVFPAITLWIMAAAVVPLRAAPIKGYGLAMNIHILSSLLAYGLLATACLHAMLLSIQERMLRRHQPRPWMQALPPLTASENLLFQLIAGGWLALSLALGSGLLFVHDLFAQHLAHKTVLSIIAWFVFTALLWGRWRHGWRGRKALYWTLSGVIFLLLAYFGSKLVLELVLNRSWQNTL